jgi:hypothetical protein
LDRICASECKAWDGGVERVGCTSTALVDCGEAEGGSLVEILSLGFVLQEHDCSLKANLE